MTDKYEKLELNAKIVTRFPLLIHETLEDWPYRVMGDLVPVKDHEGLAFKKNSANDIKLQMIHDLWGDYQHNANLKNYQSYPNILLEISSMPIYEGLCSKEETQEQIKNLYQRAQFTSLSRYGVSLMNQYTIGKLKDDNH